MPLIKIYNLHPSEERSSLLQTLGNQLVQAALDAKVPGLVDPNKVHVNLAGSRIIPSGEKPPVFIEVYIHDKPTREYKHFLDLADKLAEEAYKVVHELHSSVEVIVDAVNIGRCDSLRVVGIFPQPKDN
ncbi:MAG: hypothetical protein NT003_02930 [Candidatus Magasanikbacteria bacterium]|nr:hypothetical protein [Candidatus Magasanikbacteria bacterium]